MINKPKTPPFEILVMEHFKMSEEDWKKLPRLKHVELIRAYNARLVE